MDNLGIIACGNGLHDALNPCIFMASAVFIVLGPRFRGIFAALYALFFGEYTFGPVQVITFRKGFILAAKVLYLALGIWAFILGFLFLMDWILLHRGKAERMQADKSLLPAGGNGIAAGMITAILAVLLSAMATLAPVNRYILLLGNEAMLRGQGQQILPVLFGYVFFSMWPLWFVWAFLSVKGLRPSMLKVLYASVFFTASSCVVFMFK